MLGKSSHRLHHRIVDFVTIGLPQPHDKDSMMGQGSVHTKTLVSRYQESSFSKSNVPKIWI